MVTVTIFVEGGDLPNANANAQTVNNTQALRQAFNELINACFEEEKVRIKCEMAGSYKSAIKQFTTQKVAGDTNIFLLIDLDNTRDKTSQRLAELGLSAFAREVFFMVQAMEAWILSQPERIVVCFQPHLTTSLEALQQDPLIAGITPESQIKPDRVLDHLLKNHFIKNDKPLAYGKLKNAPDLIKALEINKLRSDFIEVHTLLESIAAL